MDAKALEASNLWEPDSKGHMNGASTSLLGSGAGSQVLIVSKMFIVVSVILGSVVIKVSVFMYHNF
jgi:hypothetical protein